MVAGSRLLVWANQIIGQPLRADPLRELLRNRAQEPEPLGLAEKEIDLENILLVMVTPSTTIHKFRNDSLNLSTINELQLKTWRA